MTRILKMGPTPTSGTGCWHCHIVNVTHWCLAMTPRFGNPDWADCSGCLYGSKLSHRCNALWVTITWISLSDLSGFWVGSTYISILGPFSSTTQASTSVSSRIYKGVVTGLDNQNWIAQTWRHFDFSWIIFKMSLPVSVFWKNDKIKETRQRKRFLEKAYFALA